MLQHIALETRREDVDAEVAFWSLLGFARVEPPSSLSERAAWLQSGPTQIHLLYAEAPRTSGHTAVIAPAPFATTISALDAAGHPTQARTPHWGAARAYVHSPGGHLVEVMAAPPPSG